MIFLLVMVIYKTSSSRLITKINGYSILKVISGSMEPEFMIGDIIIIKECDDYQVNDVITYNVQNQYLVTHRIIERQGNNFVTKGDNNNTIDFENVTIDKIEGKVICNSKLLKMIYKYKIIFIVILVILVLL